MTDDNSTISFTPASVKEVQALYELSSVAKFFLIPTFNLYLLQAPGGLAPTRPDGAVRLAADPIPGKVLEARKPQLDKFFTFSTNLDNIGIFGLRLQIDYAKWRNSVLVADCVSS